MSDDSLANLARKLAESVPEGLKSMRDDLEQNFRSVLATGIGKLNLVSREEFDIQQAVLARTRQKLELLEERLGNLEQPAKKPGSNRNKAARKKAAGKKTAGKKTARKKTS